MGHEENDEKISFKEMYLAAKTTTTKKKEILDIFKVIVAAEKPKGLGRGQLLTSLVYLSSLQKD